MRDFLEDFRENWSDSYWWADHQWLMAIVVGIVGLSFHGLQLLMDRKWGIDG